MIKIILLNIILKQAELCGFVLRRLAFDIHIKPTLRSLNTRVVDTAQRIGTLDYKETMSIGQRSIFYYVLFNCWNELQQIYW